MAEQGQAQPTRVRGQAPVLLGQAYAATQDVAERIEVHNDGMGAQQSNMTAESSTMPSMFSENKGHYTGEESMLQYLRLRFTSAFSAFTLYSPYLIIMYMTFRAHALAKATTQSCLRNDFMKARQNFPHASEEELLSRVIRHSIPNQLAGSPAWHRRRHLDDLLCATSQEYHGMPHLFVTLTSDEFSETRWPAFANLDQVLQRISKTLSWRDTPIESARIFRARLRKFWKMHVCPGMKDGEIIPGILGWVKHRIIRYEVQGRGSLHEHICVWLHEDDVEEVCSHITAHKPGMTNPDGGNRAPPSEHMHAAQRLHDLVIQKQLH